MNTRPAHAYGPLSAFPVRRVCVARKCKSAVVLCGGCLKRVCRHFANGTVKLDVDTGEKISPLDERLNRICLGTCTSCHIHGRTWTRESALQAVREASRRTTCNIKQFVGDESLPLRERIERIANEIAKCKAFDETLFADYLIEILDLDDVDLAAEFEGYLSEIYNFADERNIFTGRKADPTSSLKVES